MNQEEYFGFGSIKNLKKIIDKHNVKNIFLVTGKNSYSFCGMEKILNELLKKYNVQRFFNFENNPKFEDIKKGMDLFKKNNYDLIIGAGGGSVIDVAKLINIFSAQKENPLKYVLKKEKIKNKGKTFVAITTTSGSGSETTHFAVIYLNKIKYSVAQNYLLPDYSIIDPQFTMNVDPYLTAVTGMDALSQAIESFWCVNSTDESKKYAKEAIRLIIDNIIIAVNDSSKESKINMAKASNLAGKAINITKTTAPHALSYNITTFFGVPHGHAVALTLPEILVYNYTSNQKILDKRGENYLKKNMEELFYLLKANDVYSSKDKIITLMKKIGLKTSLSDMGIFDINKIIDGVNLDRLKNNPRFLSKKDLRNILRGL